MSDEMVTLVTVLGLLFLLFVGFAPFVLFMIYVFYQNSKRKRIRERLLTAQQGLIGGRPSFPVRYASADRFKSWFKIFPWEGAGVLLMEPASVTFLGEMLGGAGVHMQFVPSNSQLSWLGKCPWPNGAVSWFLFETPTSKHYFSSETGPFVFGSNDSTRKIFEEGMQAFAGGRL